MTMQLSHVTEADPTLNHQVVFVMVASTVWISCNCRATVNHNATSTHDPIAPSHNLDESRRIYNDPSNHWESFTDEDRSKW